MNKHSISFLLYGIGIAGFILVCWVLIHQVILVTRVSDSLGEAVSLPTNAIIKQSYTDAPQVVATNKRKPTHGHGRNSVITATVEVGPIDIHRRYRSMEGPEAKATFRIDRLIASKRLVVPASTIHLIENDGSNKHENTNNKNKSGQLPMCVRSTHAINSTSPEVHPIELYWFKGVKIDVLDENDKVMATPEFLCHVNVDTRLRQHYFYFPSIAHSTTMRMVILSQGTTQVMLPQGTGVPFAGKEELNISLQAINKTTEKHRSIKLRLKFYFLKDQDLSEPISALNWSNGDLLVAAKDSGCKTMKSECGSGSMCCTNRTEAEDAPNNWLHRFHRTLPKNRAGQPLSWHWVVPPGVHQYYAPINDERCPSFSNQGPIKAAWLHVHPFCKSVSLIEYLGQKRRVLFTARSQTLTTPGIEIRHNDFLTFAKEIPLNKDAHYGLESVYDNTSGHPQDAMVIVGMFFSDPKFKKPAWAI